MCNNLFDLAHDHELCSVWEVHNQLNVFVAGLRLHGGNQQ